MVQAEDSGAELQMTRRRFHLSFVALLKDTQLLCVVWWAVHGNKAGEVLDPTRKRDI